MSTTTEQDQTDELMLFEAEPSSGDEEDARRWRLMIVDDDEDVHTATLFALENIRILGRRLEFLHAYSAAEARGLFSRENDIAVILLDVVMEREDAGLTLVRHIRDELQMADTRIILRTGQPGYAPEIEAIRDYDINDYKTKSELTRAKLYTTLTASIRSYDQIRSIDLGRNGLDSIVRGSAELMRLSSIEELAAAVIDQLSALLRVPGEGLICARETVDAAGEPHFRVVAAVGGCASEAGRTIKELRADIGEIVRDTVRDGHHRFERRRTSLYVASVAGRDLVIYLETSVAPGITERKLLEVFCSNVAVCLDNLALVSKLRSQAYFDQLLMLPNRMYLVEEMDRFIDRGGRESFRVVLVDIDHFAETNDALGHRYGDSLLRSVAVRLRRGLSSDVILARVAGDAFGVFGRSDQLQPETILSLFAVPFDVDGVPQTVSATLGLASFVDIEGSGVDALKAASIALKRAKQERRGGFSFFTREMAIDIRARVKLLEELRGAFASDRLLLHYQPQVRLDDEKLVGLEALIRWKSEDGRFIPPDRFIPLAEHSGLIIAVGEWVMRTAMLQLKMLCDEGFCGVRMAINVSVVQFRHPDFLDMVDSAIAASGVNPSMVELEITESVAMLEADYMVAMLGHLKERGLQIAVDDFGTGFSSLSYLQKLAVDRLKIDRSFINQMNEASDNRSIAAMVIDLGRNLGLSVIAEGVEDAAQASRLRELGCHEAQGFYYARPMDERTLRGWICEHQGL